jgi:hypothetical protein
MLKRFLTGLVLGLIVLAVPAFGTVYDYTTSGMNGSDWAGISNGNWLGWATVTPSDDRQKVTYSWSSDGAGMGSMMAALWTAPAGETITNVTFNYEYNLDPSLFTPVIYTPGATEKSLSTTTPIVWQANAYGWSSGSDSITFSEDDNVQKVAVGLNVPKWGLGGYFVEFSDVVITTVPEPATIVLLSLGGLLLRRKK